MDTIELIVLTKSRKNNKFCVAGIHPRSGEWYRLCSDDTDADGALSDKDMVCDDGSICKPLDLVRVSIIRRTPEKIQCENCLIDARFCWEKIRIATVEDVLPFSAGRSLDTVFGSYDGTFSEEESTALDHSLELAVVTDLDMYDASTYIPKPKVKANFSLFASRHSDYSVTDLDYRVSGLNLQSGLALLVISTSEKPWKNGLYYKYIAKIFPDLPDCAKRYASPAVDIVELLRINGYTVVDYREKAYGRVWVVKDHRPKENLECLLGNPLTVLCDAPNGGRATGYRPAWYFHVNDE